jgi:hypothetical protein
MKDSNMMIEVSSSQVISKPKLDVRLISKNTSSSQFEIPTHAHPAQPAVHGSYVRKTTLSKQARQVKMKAAKKEAMYFMQKPHFRNMLAKSAMPVAALNLNLAFDEEESAQPADYL